MDVYGKIMHLYGAFSTWIYSNGLYNTLEAGKIVVSQMALNENLNSSFHDSLCTVFYFGTKLSRKKCF